VLVGARRCSANRLIDGLVEIVNVDRSSATLQIGALFPPLDVATRYAECIPDHLDAGEPLECIPIDDSPRRDDPIIKRFLIVNRNALVSLLARVNHPARMLKEYSLT